MSVPIFEVFLETIEIKYFIKSIFLYRLVTVRVLRLGFERFYDCECC